MHQTKLFLFVDALLADLTGQIFNSVEFLLEVRLFFLSITLFAIQL